MNNRKNQNSILVLATLGVYLGLVLAGATPTVWAQAATTRQFDVKDEIETTDDVDKNPDDSFVGLTDRSTAEIDHKIFQSLKRLFGEFRNMDAASSGVSRDELLDSDAYSRSNSGSTTSIDDTPIHIPFRKQVTLTNFPRAHIYSSFAFNAK